MKSENQNIILIGFMGTGKSSVGRALASKLKRRLIELDKLIEKQERKTISRIFKEKGEPYFRRIERKALKKTLPLKKRVISTGGGIILNPLNIKDLRKNGFCVCLTASLKELSKRTSKNKKRPLLSFKNSSQTLQKLLKYRLPLYRKASDITVKTTGKTATQTANAIINKLKLN